MNSQNSSPSGESSILKLLRTIGNALLALVVAPFMLLNEWRLALDETVYQHGIAGGFRKLAGGLLSFAAAGAAGYYLGWTLSWPTAVWVVAGVISWFATLWYLFPLFYLFPVRPAIKLAELGWDAFRKLSKKYADRTFGGIVRVLSSVLPGSSDAWAKVEEKKNNWVSKSILGLAYPISLAASAYLGYQLYSLIAASLSSFVLGTTLGVGAGLLAGLLLVGALWQCIEEGKLPFVAVALTLSLDRLFSPELGGLSTLLQLHGIYAIAVDIVSAVLFIAYLFPLAHIALSGGLIKWMIDHLKPLNTKAYDDRDRSYTLFFHNISTLAATAIVVWLAYIWAGSIALPAWASVLALVILGLATYLWVYDVVDHGGGTFITGAASSLYAGWWVGSNFSAWGHAGGIWIAIPLGILTTLLSLFLLFPLAYLILKPICVWLKISLLGKPLSDLHKICEQGFQKLSRELMKVYDKSYRDRSGYQIWFLHAANIAFAVFAALSLPFVAAHSPAAIAWVLSFTASPFVLALASYILVGRFLQKSSVGTEFAGGISSLALAVWFSSVSLAATASWWSSIIVGVLAWAAGFVLLFPLAYLATRLPARYLLASWTSFLLVKLHDFAWSLFAVVWDRLVAVYKALYKLIFLPLKNVFASASHRVSEVYRKLRDKILGNSRN